jgi:hypothetical protein
MSGVQVYSVGVVCASACAPVDMPREEVERAVNAQCPTGIASRWQISTDETFANGDPMPRECNSDPGRQHWLLNC